MTPGLGGCSKSHSSATPYFFPGRADMFSQVGISSSVLPFPDRRGRAGRRPTTCPGTRVGCTMPPVALEAKFSLLQMWSWAINTGLWRNFGGWESAKSRQCGFYMLWLATLKFCITDFWSCSTINWELCSNSKCIQTVPFRSRPAIKGCRLESHAQINKSYYLIFFPNMCVWDYLSQKC